MINIHLEVDDRKVVQMLQRLINAAENPRPALLEIGEDLTDSTKDRFGSEAGPDGEPWVRNNPVTIVSKGRDQPLTGRGTLMDQIGYQLTGNDTLEVGSPTVYAAMQQFGGTKSEFPHLWGDIPARPFIGISEEDGQKIIDTFNDYLKDQIG
ncbi:phage virion morphogenesis (putative tail completion) protein [Nitrosomonas aestuarii]|uniref:Phage virion morphogenesis (Putative tail completion) protein n=1 Tax=Nitrosomonas aestuarii TaxID=52441 RepID=A0A1I4DK22_9PROT|nr:phage virion morphogenesis protein [Nitrosomonas aestuarii]SFK92376.1 phage virion morphogenesis (putative tail completion) protein [Nitrosomonas aestuarii]